MKYRITLMLLLSCYSMSFAQEQAAIWYFGNGAGLDFNSGAPVALTDGVLNTIEGCATISDTNGGLLFYTDGVTVWTRNHQPMPNGLGLGGHPSSTQSGIIVPWPGNPDLYYIFTTDERGNSNGLQYNIVDMSLNGGLGDVTSSNNVLQLDMTEKLTAVSHANGSDIWVISHRLNGNEYVSYQITPTGLIPTPIVTSVGLTYSGVNAIGYMKASPNGRNLAIVASGTAKAEVLQFDAATGVLSNAIDISSFYNQFPQFGLINLYGVEFSPNSQVLYISNANNGIHQFDLSSYNTADIINSGIQIAPTGAALEIGGMQLAIDGKIYVTQAPTNYLGAINNPNTLGLGSNYIENVVSLGSGMSNIGLPPFIQSYFIVGIEVENFCLGDSTNFSIDSSDPITSISWDFGDGNSSNLENPTHVYATPGTYTVSVTATTASETKTESKDITIYEVPMANPTTDFEVCSTNPTHQFDLSIKDAEVLGIQLATDHTINYYPSLIDARNRTNPLQNLYTNSTTSETIFARISNVNNPSCFDTSSFDLLVNEAPVLNSVADWVVCDTDSDGFYVFDLSQKDDEVLSGQSALTFSIGYFETQTDADNNTNSIGPNYTNTASPQTVYFRIQNSMHTECYETGSFNLEVIPLVMATTPTEMEVCDIDNDGFFAFDLSTKNNEILGGQSPADFNLSYHNSQSDADNSANALNTGNHTNTTPYFEMVYARVESNRNPDCYHTTNFELRVYNSPTPQVVTDWQVCDDDNDGIQSFDLTQKNAEVLGSQPSSQYAISYHPTQADANLNTNAIIGSYQNTSNPQTIYFRIENNSSAMCYLTDSFVLEVFDTPTANMPLPIIVCDDNETGMRTFDLSTKDSEVLNGQNASQFELIYFANQADADTNQNALSKTAYTNTNLNETIFARIQNMGRDSCYDVTNFEIIINPIPQPYLQESYVICPDSPELTIDGGSFEGWSWRDQQNIEIGTAQTIAIATLGDYSLTVTQTQNGISCTKSVVFEVISSGAPEDFTVEISNFSDQVRIEVEATGIGDFEYSVDGENFQDSNLLVVFPGTYTVYVRDTFLCRTISKEVIALGYQKFFTPNGDGTHDYWNVIGAEHFTESKIFIFDRQGKLLQQLAPDSRGWDGTFNGVEMPSSDYWFRFENEDGNTFTGHFSLKR